MPFIDFHNKISKLKAVCHHSLQGDIDSNAHFTSKGSGQCPTHLFLIIPTNYSNMVLPYVLFQQKQHYRLELNLVYIIVDI